MKKLIEIEQKNLIECDNPACDFAIKSETGDPNEDISEYLNKPCTFCGENLLTEKDHIDSLKFMKMVNWINKWFSWLSVFSRGEKIKRGKVKIHNGIKIMENEG